MMISFWKPYYGSISEELIRGVKVEKNKFYVLDTSFNKYEIKEEDYNKLLARGFKKYE